MFSFFKKRKSDFVTELERFLGFDISDSDIYKEAFLHTSKKAQVNYQRLEFLGDAVLNLIIAHYVFKRYKKLPEGDLTKYRTKLVNKQTLKELSIKLGIQKWIQHQLSEKEFEKSSVLGDVLEALIGAIYLDKGLHFSEKFIEEKIIHQLNEVKDIEDTDYKSKIIRYAQKYKLQIQFKVKDKTYLDNETIFKVVLYLNNENIAESEHYSKKQAEQLAAKEALIKLNIVD